MKRTSLHLLHTIQQSLPLLSNITDEQASVRPSAGKWTAKEIIGHLLDSACNNQQKFVRTIIYNNHHFPPYAQDEWVAVQHYNSSPWRNLLLLWEAYNLHIAHIIQHIPADALQHELFIGGKGPYTLEFIACDYVEHLKHHLKAMLPQADFLSNTFEMVY